MNWKDEVEKVIGSKTSILVGNKLDLANKGEREVGESDGVALMNELNALNYYETSAKQGTHIDIVFKNTVLEILKASSKI
jgi:GTPase SAR1 family protein